MEGRRGRIGKETRNFVGMTPKSSHFFDHLIPVREEMEGLRG